ncbi:hypothetical protein U3516DRAFT_744639 [Neocallimastix sp. 'constans']
MKDILKYVGLYNHYEKEFDAFINDYKNIKLKMNIEKVYFYRFHKNKKKKKIGFICPEYSANISQITRNIKEQLPPDETKFDEIPDESKYYIKQCSLLELSASESSNNYLKPKLKDNGRPRNDIVELWFRCLINLNNININLYENQTPNPHYWNP